VVGGGVLGRSPGGIRVSPARGKPSPDPPRAAAARTFENLSLVGFMTSGKSAVGLRLATLLGWEFIDVDTAIEKEHGAPVAEIFAARGENTFRSIESAALARALAGSGRVVATGGGAVLREENRHVLCERGRVIWLRISPASVLGRLGRRGIDKRPLFRGADRDELAARIPRLIAEREPLYRACAHWAVIVDGRRADQVATEIARAAGLGSRTASRSRAGAAD